MAAKISRYFRPAGLAALLAGFRMHPMSRFFDLLRLAITATLGCMAWLAAEQTASAQMLLAQSGMAKTAIGYVLVFLALILALLVICRPSSRKLAEGDEKKK